MFSMAPLNTFLTGRSFSVGLAPMHRRTHQGAMHIIQKYSHAVPLWPHRSGAGLHPIELLTVLVPLVRSLRPALLRLSLDALTGTPLPAAMGDRSLLHAVARAGTEVRAGDVHPARMAAKRRMRIHAVQGEVPELHDLSKKCSVQGIITPSSRRAIDYMCAMRPRRGQRSPARPLWPLPRPPPLRSSSSQSRSSYCPAPDSISFLLSLSMLFVRPPVLGILSDAAPSRAAVRGALRREHPRRWWQGCCRCGIGGSGSPTQRRRRWRHLPRQSRHCRQRLRRPRRR